MMSTLCSFCSWNFADPVEKFWAPLNLTEVSKRSESAKGCAEAGWGFRPVCFETTGAYGKSATAFVRLLVRKLALRSGEPVAQVAGRVGRGIALAQAKGCAEMLVGGSGRLTRPT